MTKYPSRPFRILDQVFKPDNGDWFRAADAPQVCVCERVCVCVCVCEHSSVWLRVPVYKQPKDTTVTLAGDLRRELPFSIKSFEFGDALFLGEAHGRPPPPSPPALPARDHPHVPSAWFFFLPSSSSVGLTHFSAMVVSLAVALGKDESTDVHVAISPLTSVVALFAPAVCRNVMSRGVATTEPMPHPTPPPLPQISATSC